MGRGAIWVDNGILSPVRGAIWVGAIWVNNGILSPVRGAIWVGVQYG